MRVSYESHAAVTLPVIEEGNVAGNAAAVLTGDTADMPTAGRVCCIRAYKVPCIHLESGLSSHSETAVCV